MSTSWDWKTNISEKAINKTVALGTSNYVPKVQSGALFQGQPDDPQIYLYGGVTPDVNTSFTDYQAPTTNQYTLWGFNTDSYGWTQYDVMIHVPGRPSWGAFAEVPEHGLAFYLNGLVTNMSSAATETANISASDMGGMVVLDLQNHTATNRSTDTVADSPRVRGGMVVIPQIGKMGVLVSLGGATGIGQSLHPVSMNQVNIFDIETVITTSSSSESSSDSSGWYRQTITGEAPSPRVDFCVVVVAAPDNSSFNIYMYGGKNTTSLFLAGQDEYFDDIWVLSIPSFTWTKVYQGVLPRFGHTCHVVGNRQMITVGGINGTTSHGTNASGTESASATTDSCDWEWMGVAILDLTSMAWGSVFDRDKPRYQVSALISAVVGGGPDGGATRLLPDDGWTSAAVANLFTGSSSLSAPYAPPSPNAAGPDEADDDKDNRNVGAIVGGAVGGGGGFLVVLAALGLWWNRRRKKKKRKRERRDIAEGAAELGEQKEDNPQTTTISPGTGTDSYLVPLTPLSELGGSPVISELPANQIAVELADRHGYDRDSWRPGEREEITLHKRYDKDGSEGDWNEREEEGGQQQAGMESGLDK
ncbi:hypothetical protein SLS62_003199 [Diatrype stigma]|uniref:Kelch repeat-containing protein n=1 Tax=Diatrype stigma TaxID=117547 RepID=A0AAN9UZ09_9PEZI